MWWVSVVLSFVFFVSNVFRVLFFSLCTMCAHRPLLGKLFCPLFPHVFYLLFSSLKCSAENPDSANRIPCEPPPDQVVLTAADIDFLCDKVLNTNKAVATATSHHVYVFVCVLCVCSFVACVLCMH